MNKKPVIAYLHTHWDLEWYKTQSAFDIRLVEVFDGVLQGLLTGDIPYFYFDGQVLALLNYLKFRPEKTRLVKKFIKEKRLFIGPFFVSIDSFLSSGMTLCKNLEFGLKISKKFGQDRFIGYLCDTFGHSKSIFEILRAFGIENAVIWRGAPDCASDFTFNGIKTTRLVRGYYQELSGVKTALDKISEFSSRVLLLPLGADHLAPPKNPNKVLKAVENYEIELKTPFEYFEKADFNTNVFEGEMLDNSNSFILPGVRTIRTMEKVENAKLEWKLFNKVSVFNFFAGKKYNAGLDFAAAQLLKNQAHDSIYGCSIDEVNQTVKARQIVVNDTADTILENLIRDFKAKYLIKNSTGKIGVFNFSNYPQKGTAKIISDKKIKYGQKIRRFKGVANEILSDIRKNPMTEDFHTFYEYLVEVDSIAPFSFKNFELKPPEKRQMAGVDFIENENLKLFVLNNEICCLDKKSGKIFENIIELHSTKDGGDSYNFAPESAPKPLKLKSFRPKNGIIQSSLELKFEENISLKIFLNNNAECFKIDIDFVNRQKNRNLQLVFNTGSPVFETYAGMPKGGIKREHDPFYSLYGAMPAPPKKELKTNSYPLQKFVQANGVTVLALGLYDYEVCRNSFKIALLRTTGIISNPKNKARSVPAGPPLECPKMQCTGVSCRFTLALGFSFEKCAVKELKRAADELFDPFVAILGEFKIKNKVLMKNAGDKEFMGISDGGKNPLFL